MTGERAFLLVAGVLVAAAIAWGLWLTGGPGAARDARLDDRRMGDLREISSALECLSPEGPVPEELTLDALERRCPGYNGATLSLVDPVDGTPYAYRRIGESGWEVCAQFIDPSRLPASRRGMENRTLRIDWDPETGCLRHADD